MHSREQNACSGFLCSKLLPHLRHAALRVFRESDEAPRGEGWALSEATTASANDVGAGATTVSAGLFLDGASGPVRTHPGDLVAKVRQHFADGDSGPASAKMMGAKDRATSR